MTSQYDKSPFETQLKLKCSTYVRRLRSGGMYVVERGTSKFTKERSTSTYVNDKFLQVCMWGKYQSVRTVKQIAISRGKGGAMVGTLSKPPAESKAVHVKATPICVIEL